MTTYLYEDGDAVTEVRDPYLPITRNLQIIGGEKRTLNGSLKQHIAALKSRWDVRWERLTGTEYGQILPTLLSKSVLRFQPPDAGAAFAVLVVGEVVITNNNYNGYDIEVTLDRV